MSNVESAVPVFNASVKYHLISKSFLRVAKRTTHFAVTGINNVSWKPKFTIFIVAKCLNCVSYQASLVHEPFCPLLHGLFSWSTMVTLDTAVDLRSHQLV